MSRPRSQRSTPAVQQAPVRRLAGLLIEAAPLVEQLNSPKASHEDRAFLRELVGGVEYIELAISLHMMCSQLLWEIAHAEDEATRQALMPKGLKGAAFDPKTATFHRNGEAP